MTHRSRPTIGDRVTRSKLPVNGTLAPSGNAPAWVATLTSAIVAWATAHFGLDPTTAALAGVIVGLVLGVAAQYLTVPANDVLDAAGPANRQPGGELGHRPGVLNVESAMRAAGWSDAQIGAAMDARHIR